SLHAKGVAPSTIMKALLEENRVHCSPPLGEAEVRTIAAHTVQQPDRADFRMSPRHLTDLGNARFLIKQHAVDLRYVRAWKRWQVWAGTHWTRRERGQAEERSKLAVGAFYTEARRQPDEEQRRRRTQHALRSESAGALRAMLELAETEPGIAVTPSNLD